MSAPGSRVAGTAPMLGPRETQRIRSGAGSNSDERVCVVGATVPAEHVAERLAATLVEERLAACVQVGGPIRSSYRWAGELCADREWTVTAKTRSGVVDALVDRIVELHPAEVPEVLVTEVSGGHRPYLDWVRSETDDPAG